MSGDTEKLPVDELDRIVRRVQQGDMDARRELFEACFHRLQHLARSMLNSFDRLRRWETTDDVWQNASLRLWSSLEHVEIQSLRHFYNLAALQIRRELIELVRFHKRASDHAAHHATPADDQRDGPAQGFGDRSDDTLEPATLADWTELQRHIEQLPAEEREVFDLIWYHGLTQPEVAEVLVLSLRTVKRRWQSARLTLFDLMQGESPGGV